MKISRYLSVLISILFFISCKNDTLESMQAEIKRLEFDNKKLIDSIVKINYNNLIASELILIPQQYTFKTNESKIVSGMFCSRQNLPKFNLYYADDNFKFDKSDKINYELTKDNRISFVCNDEKAKQKELRVIAVFDLDTIKLEFAGITGLPVISN